MSKTIIALDCMGGDNAPGEIVKGAVLAANENKDMLIKLVGREDDIKKELEKYPSSDKLEMCIRDRHMMKLTRLLNRHSRKLRIF